LLALVLSEPTQVTKEDKKEIMFCIYCGRICDYNPTHACHVCAREVSDNNERVFILSLLLEAYQYIPEIKLREKIEFVLGEKIEKEVKAVDSYL